MKRLRISVCVTPFTFHPHVHEDEHEHDVPNSGAKLVFSVTVFLSRPQGLFRCSGLHVHLILRCLHLISTGRSTANTV